jgi:hypothetical protein
VVSTKSTSTVVLTRMLVEYIVYDLDTQRITDFRLKPWVDRFLVLRASLYDDTEVLLNPVEQTDSTAENAPTYQESGEDTNKRFHLKDGTVSCPHGDTRA